MEYSNTLNKKGPVIFVIPNIFNIVSLGTKNQITSVTVFVLLIKFSLDASQGKNELTSLLNIQFPAVPSFLKCNKNVIKLF